LESRLKRHNQEEVKQTTDQADKTPIGGTDSKEAVVDHGNSHSVDALIAGFCARAVPKPSRAETTLLLQHVVSTRSPMITSVLPSPQQQALGLKQAVRRSSSKKRLDTARVTSQRAQLNGGHIINDAKTGSALPPAEAIVDPGSTLPAFKNQWALSQERVVHSVTKTHPPPAVLWFASPTVPAVL